MKEIKTSHNLTFKVSDSDYDFIIQNKWFAYRVAGRSHTGKTYLYGFKIGKKKVVNGKSHKIWLHSLLLTPPEGFEIDFIDGDTLNLQRENLRVVTHKQNMYNRGKTRSKATSKFVGVHKRVNRNRFYASIKKDGIGLHIGVFSNEIDAAKAYNLKAQELFGEYARLNDVTTGDSSK